MTPRQTSRSTPVYSTDQGRLCPGCGQARDHCACSRTALAKTGDGVVRIARQTKGRKGKGVCLVTGLPLAPEALEALARALKQRCGCGGTVKDGVIEIQGDNREVLADELKKRGYAVKLAGG
ncbi:translation initiation factor Sui1 [Desulfovibrio sp. TomC]|uniref:translation initiation factor Sui1 n=1 Tax=Desulfovibrio sp. TomC TaxID=1562888 RepID=UPI000574A33F|nr:translation initiation factor Sui1 [Desulfovibrio sp. TomC]KHK02870.1 Translation initiation factor SUI1-related protein [Desulfovibrio sp. TomC]